MASSAEPDPLKESGRYERVQSLGKGAFGFVQLGRKLQNNELAAIKFLKRGDVNKYVESEILNHSMLRHPHVIQFKEVFLTADYICIAMEYATGGSLFSYVQSQARLKEAVARWFFQQLVIGVDYCHKRGVANRDIKLENTLLQKVDGLPLPLLKICDFGYSKADMRSAAKSKVGTLTYMAPEVLVNRDGKYDGKVADIWSCGVMLYVMFYGRYPFEVPAGAAMPKATEILSMLDNMVRQKYELPAKVEVSEPGKDLLKKMLLPDPKERITLEDVMKHPWFTTNLPPEAPTMNESYLKAGFPPGHQAPDDIKRILDEAKGRRTTPSTSAASTSTAVGGGDDSYDSMVDSAINEDLKTHRSVELQKFVKTYR
ncbi:hypothetical protein PLESTB_001667900 [Pleodorina starrii]|uniref:Protein kinase domain-containing protein n=1 Tax=Pleodorina starrii TaxID=330485 RepID=A0A9W6F8W3_9CHLO|nr:hypothetical protein PLESTM_000626800 [Pleodorina starrii]GLC60762.1 hypothetical protein PLESTB_001667900 [Pleodorina starrii]GLC75481.1 hypothetical protein PLESTF_001642300 [Pleodorina starrii]